MTLYSRPYNNREGGSVLPKHTAFARLLGEVGAFQPYGLRAFPRATDDGNLLTTDGQFWHYGARTAEPKIGAIAPIPPIPPIPYYQTLLFSVARGTCNVRIGVLVHLTRMRHVIPVLPYSRDQSQAAAVDVLLPRYLSLPPTPSPGTKVHGVHAATLCGPTSQSSHCLASSVV